MLAILPEPVRAAYREDGCPIGGNIRTSKMWAIEWAVDTSEQKPEP
jgi:hypothetical protein